MKKGLKILSTSLLLSTLLIAGCSCSKDDEVKNVSRIENGEDLLLKVNDENIGRYAMEDIYQALITNGNGNSAVANKLVEFVANEVLEMNKDNSVWKTRYSEIVREKLEELAGSSAYLVNGEFSEEFMVYSLKAEGYSVVCPSNGNYGTVDNLACDYTDYVNKKIKVEALSTLLKQKYIQDVTLKDRANILTTKKIRDVEYFTVSSSLDDSYDDLSVRDFMRNLRDRIANKEVINFDDIEEELKTELKDIVETEYKKIGTSDDYSQSIATKYTSNFTQSAKVGYESKLEEVDALQYSYSKLISTDSGSSAVVSADITSSLLSITDPEDTTYARRVIKITDNDNNSYYYLVNVNVGVSVDEKDILLSETSNASTYTYSIVRFKVINSDTTDADDIYNAVKLLASESTLASNALSHYIEEKKDVISVYDDDVKTYLKSLYPDIFAE